jgi:hypothetical protein
MDDVVWLRICGCGLQMVASVLINIMVALCLLNNKVAQYESNVGAPMIELLAIWLRPFLLDNHRTTKKWLCDLII